MSVQKPVVVREVGLRDGLQILPRVLPTEHKFEWLRLAHAAGLREIEVGSFVPARLMPQLADTAELVAFAKTLPGCQPSVLVPNLKGAERAIESGAHAMLLPLSASHAHSLANLKRTPDEVVATLNKVALASLGQDDVKKRLFNSGVEVRTMGPEEFAKYTETEIQKWAKVIKASGARAD